MTIRWRFTILAVLGVTACSDSTQLAGPSGIMSNVSNGGADVVAWGPETVIRDRGQPTLVSFNVPQELLARYDNLVLHVRNGESDGSERVSSAVITVNDVQVFGPNAFSQQVGALSTPVPGGDDVLIGVELRSQPGSQITIWLTGQLLLPEWCAQDLDFNGGSLPSGWTVSLIRGGPGLVNDRLEGRPIDSGADIMSPVAPAGALRELTFEYDALNVSTFWGMHHHVGLITTSGSVWYLSDVNATFNFGANQLVYRFGWAPSVTSNTNFVAQREFPFVYGQYHYSVRVFGNQAEVTISTAAGAVIAAFVETLPGLDLAEVTQLQFRSYTTTDNATWADNLSIACR